MIIISFKDFIYLERECMRWVGEEEAQSQADAAEHRAWCGAGSQDPEIMT